LEYRITEGRRQKAEGRRQKAEGKYPKKYLDRFKVPAFEKWALRIRWNAALTLEGVRDLPHGTWNQARPVM